MRYTPYHQEAATIGDLSERQVLEYFLTRVYETEEVWGLDDGCEWVILTRDGQSAMPVWPYRQFAAESTPVAPGACIPTAESLEDFVYQTLGALMEEDALLEIMPAPGRAGCLVSPHRLHSIFTGMFDAGEYRLDG